ncbi:hypothetical protein ONZ45_g1597 [Pleurotus djamor]|nr:hypothetical protein ONZ45_g1597 [Pleurotus djamor]
MEFLLTPLQFGVPNSRLRYYLLAKMAPLAFPTAIPSPDRLWRHIPGYQASDWQDPREHESDLPIKPLRQFLDDDASECAVPDRVLQKWGRLFDIVLPSSTRTCCFTRGYTQLVERAGSILQLNEELDTTTIFDQFLEAQKDGDPLATQILSPLRLRYFSPTELLRLFYFLPPADAAADIRANFVWPESVSTKVKYRLIGNSVNVLVVTKLIDFLYAE